MRQARSDAPDEGAFSFHPDYDSEKLRNIIRGWEYRVTMLLLREARALDEWTGAFLVGVHRDVFGKLFPEFSGRCRTGEANFGRRAGPPPGQLDTLLQQLVADIRAHLEQVRSENDAEKAIDRAFRYAAIDHAEMIRIHPFVDGNGRWARIITTVFLFDCGYPVGTIIRKADKQTYIAAIDRCIDHGEPGDLANHLLRGYIDVLKLRN